jgi:hypothetical protein
MWGSVCVRPKLKNVIISFFFLFSSFLILVLPNTTPHFNAVRTLQVCMYNFKTFSLTCHTTYSLTHSTNQSINQLTHSFINSLTHTQSINQFNQSINQSINQFINHSLTHSLTHSLMHSLTHALTHSVAHLLRSLTY